MLKNGYLVSFEGLDGVGKSTVSRRVFEKLREKLEKVHYITEFTQSPIGKYFREELMRRDRYLRMKLKIPSGLTETMLFITELYWKTELEIVPKLRAGYLVISDRHIDSAIACQIPKILEDYHQPEDYEEVEDLYLNWLIECCKYVRKPDLTIFLYSSEEERKRRLMSRGRSYDSRETRTSLLRMRIYRKLMEREPQRFYLVRNEGPVERVSDDVCNLILKKLKA